MRGQALQSSGVSGSRNPVDLNPQINQPMQILILKRTGKAVKYAALRCHPCGLDGISVTPCFEFHSQFNVFHTAVK